MQQLACLNAKTDRFDSDFLPDSLPSDLRSTFTIILLECKVLVREIPLSAFHCFTKDEPLYTTLT